MELMLVGGGVIERMWLPMTCKLDPSNQRLLIAQALCPGNEHYACLPHSQKQPWGHRLEIVMCGDHLGGRRGRTWLRCLYQLEDLAGRYRDGFVLCSAKSSLVGRFSYLFKLPPANLEWLTLSSDPPALHVGGQLQISPGKLPKEVLN